MVSHPLRAVKMAAAIERGDGRYLANSLEGDVAGDAVLGLMVRGGVETVTFRRDSHRWTTDLGDEIGRSLWRSGGYETEEIEAVLGWLTRTGRTSGWIADVGANIGTTTVPFADAGYRVLAVEPVPATFAMLTQNVAANGVSERVVCANRAVSADAGVLEMWTGFGSGQAEIAVEDREPALTRWGDKVDLVKVDALPLAELLGTHDVVTDDLTLVWADVQGTETGVILSATEYWAAGVPLYLEVDPASLDLHDGIDAFLTAVATHFDSFLTRSDLIDHGKPRPITDFPGFVASIDSTSYSDALLIP
jgi:FkbM family methyltransferase